MTSSLVDLIVTQYLFGTTTVPSNLVSDTLIRSNTTTTTINIDIAAYMDVGSYGRFAKPNQFEVVEKFFHVDTQIAQGSYDLSTILSMLQLGANAATWSLSTDTYAQQRYWPEGSDYFDRTFIFNSEEYQIINLPNLRFEVDANGEKTIKNLSIAPTDDNFDFNGGDSTTNSLNAQIKSFIDPFGIGRKVNLHYTGTAPVIQNYTNPDYIDDVLYIFNQKGSSSSVYSLGPSFLLALNSFWSKGIIKFLDDNNRPIIYGTNSADNLDSDITDVYSDGFFTEIGLNTADDLLTYIKNGVVLIGGDGDDVLAGSTKNDLLLGGDDNDNISGNNGSDVLVGGNGNDSLLGGEHRDLLQGGSGEDALYGGSYGDALLGESNNDTLDGDAGFDYYLFSSSFSDGNDVILDDDGALFVGSRNLGGNKLLAANDNGCMMLKIAV